MDKQKVVVQEEIEALFISVRDIILARPNEDIAELAGLINNSPRRRRMHELELDDLQHLLQELTAEAGKEVRIRRSDGEANEKLEQQENLLLRAKIAHARQLLQQNNDHSLDLLSMGRDSTSPSGHGRPSRRTHIKTNRRSPSPGLLSDNERLKTELQRVQKDIQVQLKTLQ